MWIVTVDNLLYLLGGSDIFAQAYADDVVVSVPGKFTEVLSDRTLTACRLIQGSFQEYFKRKLSQSRFKQVKFLTAISRTRKLSYALTVRHKSVGVLRRKFSR